MKTAQIYFEEVKEGVDIPSLLKRPSTRQLVMWAGVTEEFSEVHYDKDFAQSRGFKSVIVQGGMLLSFIVQMLTDWIGEEGFLKRLEAAHRAVHYAGEDIVCKGSVVRKYEKNGEHILECSVWTENAEMHKTTLGTALVSLPKKA
ncbi:MaoC/PaaZ C-terminal domain-containing protein [Chloroflexota bacterium]